MLCFSSEECLQRVFPEDLGHVALMWKMHHVGNSEALDICVLFELRRTWHWVRIRGQAVQRDANGMALRMVGTVKDVTEHREAEETFA